MANETVWRVLECDKPYAYEKQDSVTLLYYSAPYNCAFFGVLSILTEGSKPVADLMTVTRAGSGAFLGRNEYWVINLLFANAGLYGLIVLSGVLGAVFHLFSYLIVEKLGALTSVVTGSLRVLPMILASHLIFGNEVRLLQLFGFSLMSAGCYVDYLFGEHRNKGT